MMGPTVGLDKPARLNNTVSPWVRWPGPIGHRPPTHAHFYGPNPPESRSTLCRPLRPCKRATRRFQQLSVSSPPMPRTTGL